MIHRPISRDLDQRKQLGKSLCEASTQLPRALTGTETAPSQPSWAWTDAKSVLDFKKVVTPTFVAMLLPNQTVDKPSAARFKVQSRTSKG
jgi:hypothetical protein